MIRSRLVKEWPQTVLKVTRPPAPRRNFSIITIHKVTLSMEKWKKIIPKKKSRNRIQFFLTKCNCNFQQKKVTVGAKKKQSSVQTGFYQRWSTIVSVTSRKFVALDKAKLRGVWHEQWGFIPRRSLAESLCPKLLTFSRAKKKFVPQR